MEFTTGTEAALGRRKAAVSRAADVAVTAADVPAADVAAAGVVAAAAPENSLWFLESFRLRFRFCPLYPRKRHQMRHVEMSALGQKRTSARSKMD
jgi:hypothetical protein